MDASEQSEGADTPKDILLRMLQTRIDQDGQLMEAHRELVPFSKLTSLASKEEKC